MCLASYSLSIVDTGERVVRATIPLGQVPLRVAVSPERNRAYVSNWFQSKVHVVSGPGANGSGDALLTSIAVGKGATGIAVDDAADRVYATIALALNENGTSTNQVVAINAQTHAVGVPTTIPPLRSDPEDVVADPVSGHVFVTNLGLDITGGPSPKITVLNSALQIIDHIPLKRDATHLAFDVKTRQVYAVHPDGVEVIDAVARKVTSIIPTPPTPRGVAVAPLGPRVFIGNSSAGLLTIATPIGAGPHDLTLTRPDDLLQLDFDFVNLRVDAGPGRPAKLVRIDPNAPALIIVHFPPQHLAERAFGLTEAPFRPAQARLAGATRLAFRLPSGLNEILYTVESLLDWKRFEPSLVPAALPPTPTAAETTPPPPIVEPGAAQTAIELPYRLLLSPDRTATWEHAGKPVTHRGRTEVWHTRLRVKDQPGADPALRAVWSPDFPATAPPPFPLQTTIAPAERRELVRLTSDFTLGATTRPITAEQFMLTPLGGYLKGRGSWTPPAGLSVSGWRHLATLGRDHTVRIDKIGVLLPFGHRAVHVTATEREIVPASPNAGTTPRPAAVLVKRQFIVIVEPEKRFDGAKVRNVFASKGREMPLSGVKILLATTPPIVPTDTLGDTAAFWIKTQQGDLQFPVAVTDAAGRTTEFTLPMAFVPNNVVLDAGLMRTARQRYESDILNNNPNAPRRAARVAGQRIAYAPPASPASDDTTLATDRILFNTQEELTAVNGDAPFLPLVREATARIPAVEAVTGAAQAVKLEFFDRYLAGALQGAGNQAGVFMRFIDQSIPTQFTPETAGGLARTALEFTGLSRTAGAVAGDLTKLADGVFDIDQIKQLIPENARLLGTIPLRDIMAVGFDLKKVPKLLSETVRNAAGVPEALVARLDWQPAIKGFGPFKAERRAADGQTLAAKMAIATRIEQKLPAGVPAGPPPPPTYNVDGALTDFAIEFLEILTINFAALTFQSRSGEKTSVKPKLAPGNPVVFRKELNFLDELRKQIPSEALGQLPKLDVTAEGVELGYSLALPPLAFGAFTLQNVILDGGLSLPFVDRPARVRFGFGTRNNPFNLSVLAIGGGGFVGIEVAMDRIVAIEAALEMGGNAAVDLGVARAAVWIMGGIYFKLAEGPDGEGARVELTAYLRYGGAVSVLGLVGVSIEVYLGLDYDPQANLLHGQAKVTAKAKLAFFTKTVTFKVERTIEGPELPGGSQDAALARALGAGGASFGDIYDEAHWQQYTAAFA